MLEGSANFGYNRVGKFQVVDRGILYARATLGGKEKMLVIIQVGLGSSALWNSPEDCSSVCAPMTRGLCLPNLQH